MINNFILTHFNCNLFLHFPPPRLFPLSPQLKSDPFSSLYLSFALSPPFPLLLTVYPSLSLPLSLPLSVSVITPLSLSPPHFPLLPPSPWLN